MIIKNLSWLVFVICLFSCLNFENKEKCFIKSKKLQKDVYDKLLWQSKDSVYVLRIMAVDPDFVTDISRVWIALIRNDSVNMNHIHYYLFDAGHTFLVKKGHFFSYKKDVNTPQKSFEGWYKKTKDGNFISLSDPSQELTLENGLLYKEESNDFLRVVDKKFYINNFFQEVTDSLDYSHQGLFKLEANQLYEVSNEPSDVFGAKNGVFYVPKPGTGIKYLFNIEETVAEIEEQFLKTGKFPDKLCFHRLSRSVTEIIYAH